jgi:predicted O-methyltransferase YrrM
MKAEFKTVVAFVKHLIVARRRGHGVHSPCAYQLCEEVFYNQNPYYDFEKLDRIRQALLRNSSTIEIEDHGAGSRTMKGKKRAISDIAANGISSRKQSEILYRLCTFLGCRNILELGTSIGLNSLYLALANKNSNVISIEGSSELAEFATELAKINNAPNLKIINSKFDQALPKILAENIFDLVYIDGNHTYEATINYFNQLLFSRNNNSVFVFDDIYWSGEMMKAWNDIKSHSSVKLSIDTFYSGMVFFREEIKEPIHYKFRV